jgi:hypothetical protein
VEPRGRVGSSTGSVAARRAGRLALLPLAATSSAKPGAVVLFVVALLLASAVLASVHHVFALNP